tara:strand:+ start:9502 stop:10386 length:885 start_codon:yes stop_codon:yes gene_type:complete
LFNRRLKYLIRSLSNSFQKKECPYCGKKDFELVDKKYFVTTLIRCKNCHLKHRHPKDSLQWLENFYQKEYEIEQKLMTDLPSEKDLELLKKSNFKSYRPFKKYISSVFGDKKIKILDYGCSWGYNVYKLANLGYHIKGLELSVPRAKFGEKKLGIKIFNNWDSIEENHDLIISDHVIEHLIDISTTIKKVKQSLNKDGIFMSFCPNGNNEYRKREPKVWHGSWGDIHVNSIDYKFAKHVFNENPFLILSGDWIFNFNEIKDWDGVSQKVGIKKDGKELLIISKPNIKIHELPRS